MASATPPAPAPAAAEESDVAPAAATPAPVPPIAPAPAPPVDATPPAATAPAEPPAEPALEALPTVAELMPDVRAALPTLKLSMHVFAADPAGRFVLIDGKRLVQGDAVAASLTVAEIRRDGAVLDYGGKRFLVPRP
jgi:general secretion pathway protein B